MNLGGRAAFIALPPADAMSERNRSDPKSVDRLYLLAIVLYALLAMGFVAYFIRRLMIEG